MYRILFPLLLLSACSFVNLDTVTALERLSPLTADPSHIQVRLELPEGADVAPGGAKLSLAASRADTGDSVEGHYVLARTGRVFAIAPEEQAALRALQSTAALWKETAPDETEGSLSLGIEGCQRGSGPARGATVSAFIQLAEDGPFLPLIEDAPWAAALVALGQGSLPTCPDDQ